MSGNLILGEACGLIGTGVGAGLQHGGPFGPSLPVCGQRLAGADEGMIRHQALPPVITPHAAL